MKKLNYILLLIAVAIWSYDAGSVAPVLYRAPNPAPSTPRPAPSPLPIRSPIVTPYFHTINPQLTISNY